METAAHSEHLVRFKSFELNLQTRELYRHGLKLRLHGHPIDVLAMLLEKPGELVTREALRKALWPEDTFVDFEHGLNTTINRLREILGDKADAPRFIETIPRLGYRFIASLEAEATNDAIRAQTSAGTSIVDLRPDLPAQTQLLTQPKTLKRWVTWVAATVLAALLGGGFWYFRRPLPPLRVTEYTQITHDYRNKIPVGTDGARLYMNLNRQPHEPAQVAVSGGEVTPVPVALPRPLLRDVSPDGSSLLVSSWDPVRESLWSVQVPGGSLRRLLDGAMLTSASWSPDGKLVAYCTFDGNIYVMRSDGTESHKLVSAPNNPGFSRPCLSWSPDSSKIRFTWDLKLWEMSSSGSGLHPLLPDWHPSEWQCCGRWTSEGRFFVFLLSKPLASNTGSAIPTSQIWALDERRAFLRSARPEPVQLTTGPIRWGPPIPSRDGKRIFSRGVNLRGELVRFDAQSRQLQPYLSGISAEFVTFSPDGKFVAYVTYPEGILWKANRDGSNPTQLTDPPLYPTLLRWSPDGCQILLGAANSEGLLKMYVLSSQGGRPQPLLRADNRIQFDADWSPDGRKVVFGTVEGANRAQRSIHILDVSDGQVTDVPGSEGLWSPRWSPDGRYIDGLTFQLNRDHVISSLAVFDFGTQQWSVIQEGEVGYPLWSHDGKFIYFLRPGLDPGVYRIRPSGGEAVRIVDLKGFRYTGMYRYYLGLDPEDTPLLLRDTGTDDIFALTLDDR